MADGTLIIRQDYTDAISKLSFEKGESLLLLCKKAAIPMVFSCAGKGICGKCRVRFLKGAPIPLPAERSHFSPEELRAGFRLACLTKLYEDCELLLPQKETFTVLDEKKPVRWNFLKEGCFLTADIGTTTLVIEKRKVNDGSVINLYKGINAQRKYGADVISRMEAALEGKGAELARLIRSQLEEGIACLCKEEGVQSDVPQFMVVAANTTMVHLLMEYSVEGLSKAPFMPVTSDEIVTEIGGIKTYIMPGISAFVGGDIYAGLLATEYLANEECGNACKKNGKKLLIDLGTNAELVLYDENGGICTATAAGPAFDGDAGTGFFGSDMIAVLANLYEKGILDGNGTLDEAHFETGAEIAYGEKTIHISQGQIRNLQLAKAAVRAGIGILLKKAGITEEQVEKVYLAGGFGYYLDADAAVTVGLIPKIWRNRTVACGNAALSGAALYGLQILKGQKGQKDFKLKAMNLALESDFKTSYVNHINLTD